MTDEGLVEDFLGYIRVNPLKYLTGTIDHEIKTASTRLSTQVAEHRYCVAQAEDRIGCVFAQR